MGVAFGCCARHPRPVRSFNLALTACRYTDHFTTRRSRAAQNDAARLSLWDAAEEEAGGELFMDRVTKRCSRALLCFLRAGGEERGIKRETFTVSEHASPPDTYGCCDGNVYFCAFALEAW